jgi:hypothetical protein
VEWRRCGPESESKWMMSDSGANFKMGDSETAISPFAAHSLCLFDR